MAGVRRDPRLVRALLLVGAATAVLLAAFAALALAMLGSTLPEALKADLTDAMAGRWPLLVLLVVAGAAAAAAAAQTPLRRWLQPPGRLDEQVQATLAMASAQPLQPGDAAAPLKRLALSIDALAAQRDALRADQAEEVARASAGVARERNRLAALMSELGQSVVVCNLDGRILLYNPRARMQFRALSEAPGVAGGAELIGLGRSIYAVFDESLVRHALDSVRQRLARGVAHPSAQFVTSTRSGQLLRVQVAPVREVAATTDGAVSEDGAPTLTGFVLMLDNITREHEQDAQLQQLLHQLGEQARASVARLQVLSRDGVPVGGAAAEAWRHQLGVVGQSVTALVEQAEAGLATRWPLEPMRGADFLQAVRQRMQTDLGLRVGMLDVDDDVWLKVDSFALVHALTWLAERLRDEFEVPAVHLRLMTEDPSAAVVGQRATPAPQAHLDLLWTGQAMSTETVMSWEMDDLGMSGGAGAQSVREVVQRHGGAFWFERDRVRHQAFFRFRLPQASGQSPAAEAGSPALGVAEARPEFYDFDLFANTESSYALDERPLSELTFTVFDTETTGLEPNGGDEIIQMGAVRVFNGKVLRSEHFDQLVDPQRPIPAAGIPIHGITPDMVQGQPSIDTVLPAFHAFAHDSVLVAHNAAFDMRFLQLKEARTGLRFDHPVLDTLLLSAVVHPNQESHRLEAIAERFGIEVIGRHTALGDALVTAEVLLRLLPLLAEQGIHTLGQAREAAQKTYYARIKY